MLAQVQTESRTPGAGLTGMLTMDWDMSIVECDGSSNFGSCEGVGDGNAEDEVDDDGGAVMLRMFGLEVVFEIALRT